MLPGSYQLHFLFTMSNPPLGILLPLPYFSLHLSSLQLEEAFGEEMKGIQRQMIF